METRIVEIKYVIEEPKEQKVTIRVPANEPYEAARRWAMVNVPHWKMMQILYDAETADFDHPTIPSPLYFTVYGN